MQTSGACPHSGEAGLRLGELPSVSPVDGGVLGWYAVATPECVPERLAMARVHAERWRGSSLADRVSAVRRLRVALAKRAGAAANTLAREIGKPLQEGLGAEVLPTLRCLEWLERNAPRVLRPETLSRFPIPRVLEWEPHGVVGLVSPWNYPLFLTLPVIGAALAAGNAVLWKPSELALASAEEVRRVLETAGLLSLVQIVPGGADVGAAVAEAGCDQYVVIGSAETGRAVLSRLAPRLKPAIMELSGVDPMIVCADADLTLAAKAAVWGRFTGAGQTCMAPKRVYVEERVYAAFLEQVRTLTLALRVGRPEADGADVGPVRTAEFRDRALCAVRGAVDAGARLLCGGEALPGPGFFINPAVLADCTDEMRIMREDLFAPVLCVSRVGSAEEAVRRAGSVPHALTASVWTRDRRKGAALARRLPGGVVSVNDLFLAAAEPSTPFGGSGDSGFGRVRGVEGLRAMARPRVVDAGPPSWLPRPQFYPYGAGAPRVLAALARLHAGASPTALREFWRAAAGFRKGAR